MDKILDLVLASASSLHKVCRNCSTIPHQKLQIFLPYLSQVPMILLVGGLVELRKAIDIVRTTTKSDKVILIGYSMGGVAARYHLILQPNNHHVKRLITIGSPHQGSAFAKAYNWKNVLMRVSPVNPNFVKKLALDAAKGTLETLETGVPFDAPAWGFALTA